MTKIYEGGSYAFFSVAAAGLETDGELVVLDYKTDKVRLKIHIYDTL